MSQSNPEIERVKNALQREDPEDLIDVIVKSIRLQRLLYSVQPWDQEIHGPALFELRKSLEGIFGHELP